MIRYLQKKEVWVLAISTMKYRPDPVAAAVVPVGDVVSNPGDFKIRLLRGFGESRTPTRHQHNEIGYRWL